MCIDFMIKFRGRSWQRSRYQLIGPGKCAINLGNIIFKLIIQNSALGTRCKIALRWMPQNPIDDMLTHWGWVMHICVGNLTIIGPDNGLSPGRRQAIIWTNAGILLIEPLRIKFSEISIEIHTFSFKEMHLKMSSGKWLPFCLGLNVLTSV